MVLIPFLLALKKHKMIFKRLTDMDLDEWVDHSADNRDFKTMPDYEGSNDLWLDKLLKGSEAAPGVS